ncbi:hypothetical protein PgNI_06705 [Pyricularia grisea]|uniref:Aldehyde dehydrogenase domain-containing protein n=1 Tax=Pyricularia grisea TaxID=148305 RepID=A0A6P8B583_PYRGI|nr:hypothetical protein PgNI_06705 [Pyricularia grisea]TLD10501.1 hypothetical protein PgNI_06705 [Pyricularia grisea]
MTSIIWEIGKARPTAIIEMLFATSFLEWFAEEAPCIYGDVIQYSNRSFPVSVFKQPVGVCGPITS